MNRTSPKAQPALRGVFYAIALTAVSMLAGCTDDLAAAHAQAVDQVAEQQDREALASRLWAGQQVCGQHATAVWLDSKTMECLLHSKEGEAR